MAQAYKRLNTEEIRRVLLAKPRPNMFPMATRVISNMNSNAARVIVIEKIQIV